MTQGSYDTPYAHDEDSHEEGDPIEETQSIVSALLTDCALFVDTELSPDRARATEYWLGMPFGNEEAGRSQIILTEVRDNISAIIPQIMRVYFGTQDHILEFIPRHAVQVAGAEQATDYVQWVFAEENSGFLQTYTVLKDGLIRKLGIFKWGWVDTQSKKYYCMENVSEAQLRTLAADKDITVDRIVLTGYAGQNGETVGATSAHETLKSGTTRPEDVYGTGSAVSATLGAGGGKSPVGLEPVESSRDSLHTPSPGDSSTLPTKVKLDLPPLYSVYCSRQEVGGRATVWALPPEEFLFTREARTIEDAICVAHRTQKTKSELVSMGIPADVVEEHGQMDATLRLNEEDIARRRVIDSSGTPVDPAAGEENDRVLYCEAYVYLDEDGDDIAELRKIITLGPTYWIYSNEPCDERPFAVFCPDPEPHTMLGLSWADRTMDLQLMKSSIFRAQLDSLSASLFPRMGYVEGQVNVSDLLNTEIGGPIRMRMPNAIQAIEVPFTGKEAMPLLEYTDAIAERRTGQSDGTTGLDADALQSSTPDAVKAQVNSSQAQVEMLARLLGEQCFKPLMKGLLRLLIKHQPRKRMIRLRGTWVEIDPRAWDADMDVTCNIALGTGAIERKIGVHMLALGKQEEYLKILGVANNPLVTPVQLYNSIEAILRLSGIQNVADYFSKPDPKWQPSPPQPPPEIAIEQMKQQTAQKKQMQDLAVKQAELALTAHEQEEKTKLEYKKLAVDETLRREQIVAQFKVDYDQGQLERDSAAQAAWLENTNAEHDRALAANDQVHNQFMDHHAAALDAVGQMHDQNLAEDQQSHDQDMAEQAAAQPADAGGGSSA